VIEERLSSEDWTMQMVGDTHEMVSSGKPATTGFPSCCTQGRTIRSN
jgi:hypothetical protein